MSDRPTKRLLVVMDGSQQALNAVRYVGRVMDNQRVTVVLYEVGTDVPEVLQGIETTVAGGAAKDDLLGVQPHMDVSAKKQRVKARELLNTCGFGPEQIVIKRQMRTMGAVKAIIQESYDGYAAIVVGRAGISRLKFLIFGSVAQKLVERVRHIPIIVVGGRPPTRRFLVAIEGREHALQRVQSMAGLVVTAGTDVILCRCGNGPKKGSPGAERNRKRVPKAQDASLMKSAVTLLERAGMDRRAIRWDTIAPRGDLLQEILESRQSKNCGSIVSGHKAVVQFAHAHFRGQFSESVVGALDHLAIWVVN